MWKSFSILQKRIAVLAILLLTVLLPAGFFAYGLIIRPHREPVTVVWDIKKEPELIASTRPAMAPQGKKMKGQRLPASNPGAVFVVENGMKKLVINLQFVCSQWLYLTRNYLGADGVATVNFNECLSYAAGATAATQLIYDASKIPVKFLYTYTLDQPSFSNMIGTFHSTAEIAARIDRSYSDPNFFTLAVNNNVNYSNPYILPAIGITNLQAQLLYQPGGTSVLKASQTYIPTYQNGHVTTNFCNNDVNSLVPITNFEKTWGLSKTYWLNFKYNNANLCGYGGCPLSHWRNVYGACSAQCTCMHIFGNANAWAQGGCNTSVGPWPGTHSDVLQMNRCGYPIVTTQESWVATLNTVFPISFNNIGLESEDNVFKWLDRTRSGNNYMPKVGEYKIVVAVRPFGTQNPQGYDVAGRAAGIVDVVNGWATGSAGGTQGLFNPATYLSKFGAVVINRSAPGWQVLPHEIGHILGAWHELITLPPDPNPAFDPVGLKARKLGAYRQPNGFYYTIMASSANSSVNYFSTRSFKGDGNLSLGVDEDNRAQIVKSLSYLAGENLETIKTPEQKASLFQTIMNLFLGDQ